MMPIVALISILLATTAANTPSPAPARALASPSPAPLSPDELFSRRALRRARLLIQMRVMQLRDERLECVRQALLRQLPAALWPEEPSPTRGTPNAAAAAAKCEELLKF
jgi:hypothetical protein